jgi:hypothetical protein
LVDFRLERLGALVDFRLERLGDLVDFRLDTVGLFVDFTDEEDDDDRTRSFMAAARVAEDASARRGAIAK